MQDIYSVQIEDFAKRHFIKGFEKKYLKHWGITLEAIIAELQRIDNLLNTDRADVIVDIDDCKIVKTKFKVFKSEESAKSSGNRCIVLWRPKKSLVSVLLVYHKNDLDVGNETDEWKKLVKNNYPDYKHLL